MNLSSEIPSVFVLGDSISVYYGPYLEKALGGQCVYDRKGGAAEAMANLDIPRGSNGGHSGMVLEYLQERLSEAEFKPDLLLFNAGLHDIKRATQGAPPQIAREEYQKNLSEILGALQKRGIAPVWMRTTPICADLHNGALCPGFYRFEEDLRDYNRTADEIMREKGIPVVDLHAFTLAQEENPHALFCDHAHFQPEIRARQGAFLAGWILSYFAAAVSPGL